MILLMVGVFLTFGVTDVNVPPLDVFFPKAESRIVRHPAAQEHLIYDKACDVLGISRSSLMTLVLV